MATVYNFPSGGRRPPAGSGGGFDFAELTAPLMGMADDIGRWAPKAGRSLAGLGQSLWRAAPVLGPAAVAVGSIPAIAQGAGEAGAFGAGTAAAGNIGGAALGGLIGGAIGGPFAPVTATLGAMAGGAIGGGAAGAVNSYAAQAVNDPTNPLGKALDPFITSDVEKELARRQQAADLMAKDPLRKMMEDEMARRSADQRRRALEDLQLQALAMM